MLNEIRMRHELRQSELAELMGFDQSYISALEVGLKGPPTPEFVDKLCLALELNVEEERAVREAVEASERKFVLPADASVDAFLLWKDLSDQIFHLHPAEIRLIRDLLHLKKHCKEQRVEPIRRLRRRSREEVA
jgi:transcriptional regulator with XRE-family HTH domain